jgi:hypothetical protein
VLCPGCGGSFRVRDARFTDTASTSTCSIRITPEGNETMESWRESEHDDLVLALALACWTAEWIDWKRWNPCASPAAARG